MITIDAKVTARGEAQQLLQVIRFYADRALTHEDATKREASIALVIAYTRRLVSVAKAAELT